MNYRHFGSKNNFLGKLIAHGPGVLIASLKRKLKLTIVPTYDLVRLKIN
jgi:hypothetical protein